MAAVNSNLAISIKSIIPKWPPVTTNLAISINSMIPILDFFFQFASFLEDYTSVLGLLLLGIVEELKRLFLYSQR